MFYPYGYEMELAMDFLLRPNKHKHKRISMNTVGSTHLRLNQLIDFIVYDCVKTFFLQKLDGCFAVVIISPAKDYQSKVFSQINLRYVSVNKSNF